MSQAVPIRAAEAADIPAVIDLDRRITGIDKPDYWAEIFERYGKRPKRFFLVAGDPAESGPSQGDGAAALMGFIIGEVRAWEFGSPPSGWIFAIGVDPRARLKKIGSALFAAMCDRLASAGVDTVRTMLARDDELNMTFFRSQGMMGGPFIQLEMPVSAGANTTAEKTAGEAP